MPSRSRINTAGRRLRKVIQGELAPDEINLRDEVRVVQVFRAAHAAPLRKTAAGLYYYAKKHSSIATTRRQPIVAQRLKRMRTIYDKLTREPHMALSRMEDIGGCRALFESTDQVYAAAADIKSQKRWAIVRERDYIAEPKGESGYRAVHRVAEKDGRRIEMQLRTLMQHSWAELIESTDRRTGVGLKEGRSPADVTEYYRLGSELLAASEAGRASDPTTLRRFREMYTAVSDLI
jgi:putative GTP pyrophosphokinase